MEEVLEEELKLYEQSDLKKSIFWEEPLLDLPDLTRVTSFSATVKLAPNNSDESCAFNRHQMEIDSDDWRRLCLQLQRMSRGIPAVYPTAFAASQAVPESERIYKIEDFRRGMKGFSYDPRIIGTAGHVFEIIGWTKDRKLLTFSNDVKQAGHVDIVPITFYPTQWAQKIQFASTWLNGYDFSDFNKKPEPVFEGSLGERYERSLEHLKKIRHDKKRAGHERLAAELNVPINEMEKLLRKWKNKK